MIEVPLEDWHLDVENRDAKKLDEMVSAEARRLFKELSKAVTKEEKHDAVFSYYRRFYTLTLTKSYVVAGINKSPTRDIILDYPWKTLKQDRFFCLKIWEKINR